MEKPLLDRAKEKNAVAIYFSLEASGYYSGAEYQEDIVILLEDYIEGIKDGSINDDIDEGYEISVGELDGKHSEVFGTVYVTFFNEHDLTEHIGKSSKDSNWLAYELFNDNLDKCTKLENKFSDYYEQINHLVEIHVKVPKNKVYMLKKYAEKLCNE